MTSRPRRPANTSTRPANLATRAEAQVLRAINRGAFYGLQIARIGKIPRSSVYVLLNRLERKEFINRRPGKLNCPGLPRPEYSLTRRGRAMLEAWQHITGLSN